MVNGQWLMASEEDELALHPSFLNLKSDLISKINEVSDFLG